MKVSGRKIRDMVIMVWLSLKMVLSTKAVSKKINLKEMANLNGILITI
jgi:hypothetical protein